MALTTTLQYNESNLIGQLQSSIGVSTTTFSVVFRDKVTGSARTPLSTTKIFVIDKGSSTTPNPNYEIFIGDHTTTAGVTTFTSVIRGLEFSGVSFTSVTARKKTHAANAEVGVVDVHYYNDCIVATLKGVGDVWSCLSVATHTARDADITPADGQIIYVQQYEVYEQYRNGKWWLLSPVFADATERDAAIPSPSNGMKCYNSGTGTFQGYVAGVWTDEGTSTTVNASTSVAGKVQEATVAEVGAGTGTGSTGARLFINPTAVVKTSSGAADENKIVALNASGQIPSGFISYTSQGYPADGRLTFTSGTPVQTASSTYTTVYYTPYIGNSIALYSGSVWAMYTFTERSLSLAGLAADTNFDIFIYNNSGTLTLESVAWTNDSTRATALTTQDGVYVKSGDTTRRYLGTLRTTGTIGQSAWQPASTPSRLLLWNMYNRVQVGAGWETASGGSSASAISTRAWNNDANNSLQYIIGLVEDYITLDASCWHYASHSSGSASFGFSLGLGINTSTSNTYSRGVQSSLAYPTNCVIALEYTASPSVGEQIWYLTETVSIANAPNTGAWVSLHTAFSLTM